MHGANTLCRPEDRPTFAELTSSLKDIYGYHQDTVRDRPPPPRPVRPMRPPRNT